jgi:hypothetical protein
MKNDYSIFEKVPLQEIINNDELYSDADTEKSDKEDNYLSDEEFKNKYTFLESFKKSKRSKLKKNVKHSPPEPVKEEIVESD